MARLLLIDDDEQIRYVFRRSLERAGHTIIEARNGHEGLQRYREAPTDLVITDMVMPEQGGLETILALRQEYPDAKIIAVSGGGRVGNESFLDIATRLGALRTFEKPFDLRELLAAVRELLSG